MERSTEKKSRKEKEDILVKETEKVVVLTEDQEQTWNEGLAVAVQILLPLAIAGIIWGRKVIFSRLLLHLDKSCLSVFWPTFSKREKILKWTMTHLPYLEGGLGTIWRDGSQLCTLINSVVPGACPNPHRHWRKAPTHGQALAYKYLGVIPVFTDSEFNQRNVTASIEKTLIEYMSCIQHAISKISHHDELTFSNHYIARGMGLVTGEQFRRTILYIYPNYKNKQSNNLFINIRGPYNTHGSATLFGEDIEKLYRSMRSNESFELESDNSNSKGFLKTLSSDFHNLLALKNAKEPCCDIDIKIEIEEDRAKIMFIPRNSGVYEVCLTTNGEHIAGSPYNINVEKNRSGIVDKLTDDEMKIKSAKKKPIPKLFERHKDSIFEHRSPLKFFYTKYEARSRLSPLLMKQREHYENGEASITEVEEYIELKSTKKCLNNNSIDSKSDLTESDISKNTSKDDGDEDMCFLIINENNNNEIACNGYTDDDDAVDKNVNNNDVNEKLNFEKGDNSGKSIKYEICDDTVSTLNYDTGDNFNKIQNHYNISRSDDDGNTNQNYKKNGDSQNNCSDNHYAATKDSEKGGNTHANQICIDDCNLIKIENRNVLRATPLEAKVPVEKISSVFSNIDKEVDASEDDKKVSDISRGSIRDAVVNKAKLVKCRAVVDDDCVGLSIPEILVTSNDVRQEDVSKTDDSLDLRISFLKRKEFWSKISTPTVSLNSSSVSLNDHSEASKRFQWFNKLPKIKFGERRHHSLREIRANNPRQFRSLDFIDQRRRQRSDPSSLRDKYGSVDDLNFPSLKERRDLFLKEIGMLEIMEPLVVRKDSITTNRYETLKTEKLVQVLKAEDGGEKSGKIKRYFGSIYDKIKLFDNGFKVEAKDPPTLSSPTENLLKENWAKKLKELPENGTIKTKIKERFEKAQSFFKTLENVKADAEGNSTKETSRMNINRRHSLGSNTVKLQTLKAGGSLRSLYGLERANSLCENSFGRSAAKLNGGDGELGSLNSEEVKNLQMNLIIMNSNKRRDRVNVSIVFNN